MGEVIMLFVGLLTGYILSRVIHKPKKTDLAGTLMLYKGENDEFMSLYVELERPPENLYDCGSVTFGVKTLKG